MTSKNPAPPSQTSASHTGSPARTLDHKDSPSDSPREAGTPEPTGVEHALGVVERVVERVRELTDSAGAEQSGSPSNSPGAGRADISLPVIDPHRLGQKPALGVSHGEEFLHTVIESLDHPFLVINIDDFSISMANTAARACGPQGSRHCHELTHHRASPCDGAKDPCPVEHVKRTRKPYRVEHIHSGAAGVPRHVEVHGHPVFNRDGRLVQMIEYCLDITDRKIAEAELLESRDLLVFSMAKLTESRDPETGAHLERMRAYSVLLAQELAQHGPYVGQINPNFVTEMHLASPLHDIGKVGIPDSILLKPGHLTGEEFEIMKQHAAIGADALGKIAASTKGVSFLQMSTEIARSHHERFNATGYPDRLGGDAIPLCARIVALADVFDALSSARVYKPAFEPAAARLMILAESGKHFDPIVVEAFTARWDDFMAIHQRLGTH
ncbi:MAG: HD domain-containing phosphohydrolase [Planctomycetota bacterium]